MSQLGFTLRWLSLVIWVYRSTQTLKERRSRTDCRGGNSPPCRRAAGEARSGVPPVDPRRPEPRPQPRLHYAPGPGPRLARSRPGGPDRRGNLSARRVTTRMSSKKSEYGPWLTNSPLLVLYGGLRAPEPLPPGSRGPWIHLMAVPPLLLCGCADKSCNSDSLLLPVGAGRVSALCWHPGGTGHRPGGSRRSFRTCIPLYLRRSTRGGMVHPWQEDLSFYDRDHLPKSTRGNTAASRVIVTLRVPQPSEV